MPNDDLKIGQTVYCKKQIRFSKAVVLAVYEKPPAVRVRYDGKIKEEWIVKPEEVLTEKQYEDLKNPVAQ